MLPATERWESREDGRVGKAANCRGEGGAGGMLLDTFGEDRNGSTGKTGGLGNQGWG